MSRRRRDATTATTPPEPAPHVVGWAACDRCRWFGTFENGAAAWAAWLTHAALHRAQHADRQRLSPWGTR